MGCILVTGGAGYIGSHLVKALGEKGYRVITLDDLSSGHSWAVLSGDLITGNIHDAGLLKRLFENNEVNAVLHFAAFIVVPESVTSPLKYYINNVAGTLTLLHAMQEYEINKFIFSSTAAVYGIPGVIPVTEDTPTRPINPYGSGKLMVEEILRALSHASDFNYVALRYFNVAGADPQSRIGEGKKEATHLITQCLRTAAGLRSGLDIFGTDYPTPDGTCIRDYIHVEDLANAHVIALEYLLAGGKSEVFNCGYNRGASVQEVVAAVKKVAGTDFKVNHAPRRPGDPPALVADSSKLRKILGWEPQYDDLDYIIETAWKWEQKRITRNLSDKK